MASQPPRFPSAHYLTTIYNVKMPRLVYGTAWKAERTRDLVVQAVLAGFRGIDTACQPKHYNEKGLGDALAILQEKHGIKRADLFIQTKFTPVDGQDPKRIPYEKNAHLAEQVKQSIAKSLENLQTTYIDSLLIHSPLRTHEQTMTVWSALEEQVKSNVIRQIGISNQYDVNALKRLWEEADVKPAVVQNRFYPQTGFDREVRAFCQQQNVVYQSFWTLTANPGILNSSVMRKIVAAHAKPTALNPQPVPTPEHVFFKFLIQAHPYFVPLTGTSTQKHMMEDLQVLSELAAGDLLSDQEVDELRRLVD